CLSCLTYTATIDVSPLSLHDALPIFAGSALAVEQCCQVKFPLTRSSPRPCSRAPVRCVPRRNPRSAGGPPVESRHGRCERDEHEDRKSTRLNSSHVKISYAVFCLKKK